MSGYIVAFTKGDRDPEGLLVWFTVTGGDNKPIVYGDRLIADLIAEALLHVNTAAVAAVFSTRTKRMVMEVAQSGWAPNLPDGEALMTGL